MVTGDRCRREGLCAASNLLKQRDIGVLCIHRVKGRIVFTYNDLQVAGDCQRTRKYVEADNFTGEITGETVASVKCSSFSNVTAQSACQPSAGIQI